jgi:hypothetical protein
VTMLVVVVVMMPLLFLLFVLLFDGSLYIADTHELAELPLGDNTTARGVVVFIVMDAEWRSIRVLWNNRSSSDTFSSIESVGHGSITLIAITSIIDTIGI